MGLDLGKYLFTVPRLRLSQLWTLLISSEYIILQLQDTLKAILRNILTITCEEKIT